MSFKAIRKHPVFKLIFRALIVFIIYHFSYTYLRYTKIIHVIYEYITHFLTIYLLNVVEFLLELFGFNVTTIDKLIVIGGCGGVYLDRGCLGRNVMAAFTGFLLIYPGKLKSKIWFIPFGLIIINIFNIVRIGGLALIQKYYPEYMEINHHFVFKIMVWSAILILWIYWIKKYGVK